MPHPMGWWFFGMHFFWWLFWIVLFFVLFMTISPVPRATRERARAPWRSCAAGSLRGSCRSRITSDGRPSSNEDERTGSN